MPFIDLKTSVDVSDKKADELKTAFGKAITALGKGEAWLMVNIDGEKKMYFKGLPGDIAIAEVSLFGRANQAQYDEMTAQTTSVISDILGIPSDKIYVKYEECAHWGWSGFNF